MSSIPKCLCQSEAAEELQLFFGNIADADAAGEERSWVVQSLLLLEFESTELRTKVILVFSRFAGVGACLPGRNI